MEKDITYPCYTCNDRYGGRECPTFCGSLEIWKAIKFIESLAPEEREKVWRKLSASSQVE